MSEGERYPRRRFLACQRVKFWYWQRKPAVIGRVPGYWKWESTVTQRGECLTPAPDQIEAYLTEKLAELRAAD